MMKLLVISIVLASCLVVWSMIFNKMDHTHEPIYPCTPICGP